ncbi:MAG: DUF1698 domain-containing protein [Candidatus Eisenbacteria bacterium]|nr:DUF1698 domain-containing protein [Candidatus Eisenbacteria bacterium]
MCGVRNRRLEANVPDADSMVELRREVEAIRWWHRIDLGQGIVTPGLDDTFRKLRALRLPERLDGKTVLDVGAWDGFYSFEAEKRGAARVLAIDLLSWGHGGWATKAGFDLAHRILYSKVESRVMDAMEIGPDKIGMFDVVLYLGMLYHMKHPLLALEKIFSVTREMAVIETHAVFRHRHPLLEFYPGTELLGDSTNWFGPNPAAVEGLLKTAGYSRVVPVLKPPSRAYRALRAAHHVVFQGRPLSDSFYHGRLVYHAFR